MTRPHADDPSQLKLLLAMLEHEARTPLSAIVGFADLLRADMSQGELIDTVQRIKSSAEELSDIITAMPALCEPHGRPARFADRPFELRDVIRDLVRTFQPEATGKQLELTAKIDPRLPRRVLGAPGVVRQVLANLLSNALKFTDSGRVQVEVEQAGATDDGILVRYSVADTGRGVPLGLRAEIFEPFARGEAAAGGTTPGSGLGLTVCVKLLQAMGSRIELVSQPGCGSTFSFELLHSRAEEAHPEPCYEGAPSSGDETPRILIVEDDATSRNLLRRLVQREGFAVDLACDGEEALVALERGKYALLFSDLRMAGMDGLELARRIRALEAGSGKPALPLVLVTAGSILMNGESRSLEECFDTVLLKPVRPRVLSRILAPYRAPGSGAVGRASGFTERPVDTSVISLVPDFLARRAEDLDVLRAFLAGQASSERVASIGHNMKGTALSYGFPQLGELGASLEEAAEASDLGRIARLADRMEGLLVEATRARRPQPEMKRSAVGGAAIVPIRRR